jgi:hypothetical protein
MSEKAPQPSRFQEALGKFDENMATEWENRLQGEAGKTDFSDDAKKRLEESEAYYRHMEGLDGKDRGEEVYNQQEAAFGNEWEEAIADDEAFNQAREDALEEKFASDPSLRRMRNISQEIADIRDTKVTASNDKELKERLAKREDALQELLVDYEASDGFNQAIADMLMDPADAALHNTAANSVYSEKRASADSETENPNTDDSDKASDKAPVDKSDLLSQTSDILKSVENMTLKDILTNGKSDEENAKLIGDLQAALAKIQSELINHEEEVEKAKTLKNYGGGITGLRDTEKDAHFVEDPEKAHDMANATILRPEEAKAHLDGEANFIPNSDAAHADALAEGTRIHDPAEAEEAAYKKQVLKNLAATRAESAPKKKSTLGEKYLLWKYGDGSEKSEQEKSRRKKIFFAIGSAALVGAAGLVTFFAIRNGADHSAVAPSLDKHVGGGHEFIEPTPKTHHNVTELPAEHLTHDQLTVDPGEGWASQLLDADPTLTHHDIYSDILPELLKSKNPEVQKWTMELTNAQGNIEPGISHPGQMPESVLKEALSYKNR